MNKIIGINLTRRCNLNCEYCYIGKYINTESEFNNELDISIDLVKNKIEYFNIDTVYLTGGEPLLYPKLDELIEYLYKKNITINIATNGLLITRKTLDIFKNKNITLLLSIREDFDKEYTFINDIIKNNIKIIIYYLPTEHNLFYLRNFFTKYPFIKDARLVYDSKNIPSASLWFTIIKKIYNLLEFFTLNIQVEIGYLPPKHPISLSQRKGAVDRIFMDTNGLLYNCPLMVLNSTGTNNPPIAKCNVKTCPVLSKTLQRNDIYQSICCFVLTDIKTINKFIKEK